MQEPEDNDDDTDDYDAYDDDDADDVNDTETASRMSVIIFIGIICTYLLIVMMSN